MKHYLGIEFGSTRIKAVVINEAYEPVSTGGYTWASRLENGVWTYAAEAGGSDAYKTDFRGPCALILGSEGEGVSALVKKTCDGVVSIPMYGSVNSFNVSAAAAILLSQIAHQHHAD